jgi:hypothetical protein
MGIGWFLKFIYVFEGLWISFDLLGHPVIAHLRMPKSIATHSQNLSSLLSWSCRDAILLARIARSFA